MNQPGEKQNAHQPWIIQMVWKGHVHSQRLQAKSCCCCCCCCYLRSACNLTTVLVSLRLRGGLLTDHQHQHQKQQQQQQQPWLAVSGGCTLSWACISLAACVCVFFPTYSYIYFFFSYFRRQQGQWQQSGGASWWNSPAIWSLLSLNQRECGKDGRRG